jgi:CheY-like chemotaxis protein
MDVRERSPQSGEPPPGSPLDRFEQALEELEKNQATERHLGVIAQLAVWVVVGLAVLGLFVHTFLEQHRPQVDSTTVALLAVALIAPFVPKLKALEVGGAKAEWQEGAAFSLKQILELFKSQQPVFRQLFDEVAAIAASGAQTATTGPSIGVESDVTTGGPARPLRRLLWVDDHHENNEYELGSLRQILDVVTATSNEQAAAVLESQEIDAVISDVGRDSDLPGQPPGGVQLLDMVQDRFAAKHLPVLYYTSGSSIERYGEPLEQRGAVAVTSLYGDLIGALQQVEGAALEHIARSVATDMGTVRAATTPGQPDVVVDLAMDKSVGIDVAPWLRRPQMAAFTDRVSRLADAMTTGDISRGILLVRPEVLDDRRRQVATEYEIELVGPNDLDEALDRSGDAAI